MYNQIGEGIVTAEVKLMDVLLEPNVAYLLLVTGFWLAMMAILSPGTGILEISALFVLLLSGWAIYNLPINLWALAVLILGVFPFLLAVRKSGNLIFLVISIAALVVGSSFMFRGAGWLPAVNPVLALLVSIGTAVFFWFATRKTLEAERTRPTHDLGVLIGAIGEARTNINGTGSVYVSGELWSARSDEPIDQGSAVRVIEREGFILKVEKVQEVAEVPAPQE